MAGLLWASALLSILLVGGVASDCGSSFLLLDPCNQNDSVAVKVCANLGTNLTIACNVQESAAAWLSPNFESPALIYSSMVTTSRLNGMVELKFISNDPRCILSSATIDNVQQSADGLDLFCRTNFPDRSGANISIVVINDAFASVKQIAVDLTKDEKHVDMEFYDDQECQFSKYLISEGSCSQQNDSTTIAILEQPAMQKMINVSSFSKLCVSGCTEEEVCTCQEIDLNGFTVTYSQESPEETSYFVLLSFSHDVLIESVGVSPHGNRANCNANNQTSKRVMLNCSDLSNSTTYSITVQGKASLNNSESGYQYSQFAVSLDFTTTAHMKNETVDGNGLSDKVIAVIVVSSFVFIFLLLLLIGLIVFGLAKRDNIKKWIRKEEEKTKHPPKGKKGLSKGLQKEEEEKEKELKEKQKEMEEKRKEMEEKQKEADEKLKEVEEKEKEVEEKEKELESTRKRAKKQKELTVEAPGKKFFRVRRSKKY